LIRIVYRAGAGSMRPWWGTGRWPRITGIRWWRLTWLTVRLGRGP